jgi:uncharacterized protein
MRTDAELRHPVPVPDQQSGGFWRAAASHRLAMQRCTHCGWLSYPPDLVCMRCLSPDPDFQWEQVNGRGRLRSWTVIRTAFLPGFAPDVPYVVAAVELEAQEGLQMVARLRDGPNALLAIGAPVDTVFEDVAEGISIPMFRLVAS